MAQGRWYPTCVTLPDGKVLIVSGMDDYGDYNYITEIYDPATKTISINMIHRLLTHIVLVLPVLLLVLEWYTMLWRTKPRYCSLVVFIS